MCANCPTSIFRKYVSWTKSGPAKAGPAGPLATALLLYAYDAVIFAEDEELMRRRLDNLGEWCEE